MVRKFNPAQHPRDKRGRFTKSRTVKASAGDRKAARQVADRFSPAASGSDPQARKAYLAGLGQKADLSGLGAANQALRGGKDSPDADRLDKAMVDLPDDLLLSRAVPSSAFGSTDPTALQGMKVRDAGFAPAQLGTVQAADGQVRMHIATPAGTRAAVNPETGEVVLDRDTEMVVAKVATNDAGGHDMWLTVLPKTSKTSGGEPPTPAGKALTGLVSPADATADINVPAITEKLRAGETPAEVDRLDEAMTPLPQATKMNLRVPVDYFGPDPAAAAGRTVDEPGYLMGTPHTGHEQAWITRKDSLVLDVSVPAGTPVIEGDSVNTLIVGRDVRLRVTRVRQPDDGGGFEVFAEIVPVGSGEPSAFDRAALMKLKAPVLRQQMRDRGLKPGRLRKSQMVDALVADETGAEPEPSPGDELDEDATARAVLAAAPLGLGRDDGGGLTAAQADAVTEYQSSFFYAINGQLRRDEVDPLVRPIVDAMDSAMALSKLTADVQVWRGIAEPGKVFGDRVDGDMTGLSWREDGYVSTSASSKVGRDFTYEGAGSGPTLMRVSVPRGVGAVQVSGLYGQAELVLDRGHAFTVTADHGVTAGIRRLDVEVTPKVAV